MCLSCGKALEADNAPCFCKGFRKEDLKEDGAIWCPLRGEYLPESVCAGPNCLDPAMRPVCWDDLSDSVETDVP